MVGPTRVRKRQAGLRHGHLAFRHRGSFCIEGSQQRVLFFGGHEDRHDVTSQDLLELDVLGEDEARGTTGGSSILHCSRLHYFGFYYLFLHPTMIISLEFLVYSMHLQHHLFVI